MLSDTQLTLLAIVATAAGAIIIAAYFLGLILKNQRLQLVARDEIMEWGSTIFMIGALTYLLSNPIPEFSCKFTTWLLSESVACDNPIARESYINQTINDNINLAYKLLASPDIYKQLTKLLQGSLSRVSLQIPIGVNALRNPFTDAASLGDVLQQTLNYIGNNEEAAESSGLGAGLRNVDKIKSEISNTRLGGTTTFSYQPCNYFMLFYEYATRYSLMFTQYKSTMYAVQLLITKLYHGFVWGFLVVGLLLRSFNISRKIGGFFISFSLAIAILPFITAFFIKIIQKVDDRLWTSIATNAIHDIMSFGQIRATPNPDGDSYSCVEDINLYASDFKNLYQSATSPNSGLVAFAVYGFATMLSLGMSLLAVISITIGIGRIFGIDISPFVLSYVARMR